MKKFLLCFVCILNLSFFMDLHADGAAFICTMSIPEYEMCVNTYTNSFDAYQAILDAENSAFEFDAYGQKVIVDHGNQAFAVLKNTDIIGKHMFRITADGTTEQYECFYYDPNMFNLTYDIVDANGKSYTKTKGDTIVMYTCNDDTGISTWMTWWKKLS